MKKEGFIALLLFMILAREGASLFLPQVHLRLHDEYAIKPTSQTPELGGIDIETIINNELTGTLHQGFTDVLGHIYSKPLADVHSQEGLQRK